MEPICDASVNYLQLFEINIDAPLEVDVIERAFVRDINTIPPSYKAIPPLHLATQWGWQRTVKALLIHGAKVRPACLSCVFYLLKKISSPE